jgi:hypothetical protein
MVARFVAVMIAVLLSGVAFVAAKPLPGVGRTFGYVPDAATAIRIAITVWEPIYGKEQLASERPFHATLRNGVWHVEGYLPPKMLGGVAEADIRRADGKVLHIIHGL